MDNARGDAVAILSLEFSISCQRPLRLTPEVSSLRFVADADADADARYSRAELGITPAPECDITFLVWYMFLPLLLTSRRPFAPVRHIRAS